MAFFSDTATQNVKTFDQLRSDIASNTFDMEWPPHSGTVQTFPEIDRVEWFDLDEARRRLKAAQVPFLDRLQATLASDHT